MSDELNARERAFIEAVIAVCQEFDYSLGHEDSQGGFLVLNYKDGHADWLRQARWDPYDKGRPEALPPAQPSA